MDEFQLFSAPLNASRSRGGERRPFGGDETRKTDVTRTVRREPLSGACIFHAGSPSSAPKEPSRDGPRSRAAPSRPGAHSIPANFPRRTARSFEVGRQRKHRHAPARRNPRPIIFREPIISATGESMASVRQRSVAVARKEPATRKRRATPTRPFVKRLIDIYRPLGPRGRFLPPDRTSWHASGSLPGPAAASASAPRAP